MAKRWFHLKLQKATPEQIALVQLYVQHPVPQHAPPPMARTLIGRSFSASPILNESFQEKDPRSMVCPWAISRRWTTLSTRRWWRVCSLICGRNDHQRKTGRRRALRRPAYNYAVQIDDQVPTVWWPPRQMFYIPGMYFCGDFVTDN